MRWDRLFADLEARVDDLEREDRDALVAELSDGEWAETGWRHLVGGRVTVEVLGGARVEGVATLVNDQVLQIAGDRADHVVSTRAVAVVHAAERRADEPGRVATALGWGHVFRALRDAGEQIVVRLADGSSREGVVTVVGRDFVRVATPSGSTQDVVWAAIVMVSGRT